MKKISTYLTLLLLLSTIVMYGQRTCGSMEVLEQQLQANPAMEQRLNQLETFTRTYNHNQGRALANGIITIPVIVHVLYQNSTENISDALINSQIAVLTDDFRRMNNDAK